MKPLQACPLRTLDWTKIILRPTQSNLLQPNKYEKGIYVKTPPSSVGLARQGHECVTFKCHPECSESGCWGTSDFSCISCKNAFFGQRCLSSCADQNDSKEPLYPLAESSSMIKILKGNSLYVKYRNDWRVLITLKLE